MSTHLARVLFQTFLPLFLIHMPIIKHNLMISSNNNLILEIYPVKQIKEIFKAILSSPFREITSMYENISFYSFCCLFDYFIWPMRVWYCDYLKFAAWLLLLLLLLLLGLCLDLLLLHSYVCLFLYILIIL